ncbi:MAG: enoyl-CoA hydratase/isomerase family protein [Deltaproteobacteria bacterium]|nr:enoyl-CoA hydratase/isomerase family protein [Deltaproteobacteria bacterium]
MTERVTLAREDDGIAVVTMRDEANRNAFTEPFVDELQAVLRAAATDGSVRVILLRGLPGIFCAGAHQDLLLELTSGEVDAADILLSKAVLDLPVPSIAAMEGHAVGGGLALGLCCDVLLMARESRYGCSFMNMGFTPGMGITRLLQDAVGEYLAREMMFGGEIIRGARFEARSGVNHVLPREQVWPRALQIAKRIADKPRHALVTLKANLSIRHRRMFEETRTLEAAMHRLCFAQPETRQRILENYTRPEPGREGETP